MKKVKSIDNINKSFIQECIENLDNKPYQNEAQFQFALANKILNNTENLFVDIEAAASDNDFLSSHLNRKNFDIIVSDKEGKYIAIELKYKTKDKTKNISEFIYNNNVRIACQGASNISRYLFIYDIHRLENLQSRRIQLFNNHKEFRNFIKGFAIMVTNDSGIIGKSFQENSTLLYNSVCLGDNTNIRKECLHPSRDKHNNNNYTIILKSGKDSDVSKYKCEWKEFYNDDSNNPIFKYLIIEVN